MSKDGIAKGIFVSAMMVICGLILGAIIISASWSVVIHERAFHCVDDTGAFLGFMGGLDSCRMHDTLSAGWTWDRIETIRVIHVSVFWVMAFCPLLYLVYNKGFKTHAQLC